MTLMESVPGFDLTVVKPGISVSWTNKEIASLKNSPDSIAVRRARITVPAGFYSLMPVLEMADVAFEEVAKNAGADVIPHEWGLAKIPDASNGKHWRTRGHYLRHDLLPEGYSLVAEVPIVRCRGYLDSGQKSAINDAIREHSSRSRNNGMSWNDLSVGQFCYGATDADTEARLWLVDIEPSLNINT